MDRTVATTAAGSEPVYPMPAPPDDGRFTYGVALDVAAVLGKHGYPTVTSGPDLKRLMRVLHGFLYQPAAFGADPAASPSQAAIDAAKFSGLHAVAQAVEDEVGDDYGHDRIENVTEPGVVPTGVDGEAMTGRPISGAPVATFAVGDRVTIPAADATVWTITKLIDDYGQPGARLQSGSEQNVASLASLAYAADRSWCGAHREIGGQQPCPISAPCAPGVCALGESGGA